jgi:hypothetical protein
MKNARDMMHKKKSFDNAIEDEQRMKVEKYKKVLKERKAREEEELKSKSADFSFSQRDLLTIDATHKWNAFIHRCNKVTANPNVDGAVKLKPSEMKGFIEVITTVANTEMGNR